MTDLLATDTLARERALDPRASILLEAPAGSGKTTVLTQRILRLLACVDEPEEVLAITFTRKAAAEMRERVLEALGCAPGGDSPHSRRTLELALAARRHAAARNWGLERNPARLRIQTIDSLNHSIASQLPIAARAGGRLAVHDRSAQLHRLAARRTLEDADGAADLQADTALLFERLDNDWNRFERLLAEMLARRAHWLPLLLRGSERSLREIVEEGLEQVVTDALRMAAARIPAALLREAAWFAPLHARRLDRAAARLLAAGTAWPLELGASATLLPWWQCLASLALTTKGEWRKRLNATDGFPPAEARARDAAIDWIEQLQRCPGALAALVNIAELPPTRLELADAAALAALSRVLRFAAVELEVIFQEQGQVDHPYVAAAARRALTEDGEPTDLALRLGAGVRHVLIDEFQDTSAEQFELVRALTAGWEEGDGRTLFAVGDPMQSIYQFREAEVALFLRARDYGIGGVRLEALSLTRNFRSLPGLVEWNNATFARIFPPLDDPRASAVAHAPSVAARAAEEGAIVALHRTPAADPATEAALVVELVSDMRRRDPDGSIAILVSARQHATPITGALLAAGIPVSGVDLVPLAEVPVVRDLAALTRALDHRGDRTAWLSILRAPWCGLSLEELAPLASRGDASSVWEALGDAERRVGLDAAARERLDRFRAVLEPALAADGRLPLAARVETTWLALGGPSACRDADELVNAEAFLRALARRPVEVAPRGSLQLDELLDALFASSAAGVEDAVQVMTMHRAKGLEFDRVILPGLGRRPRNSADPLLRWLDLPRAREGSDLLLAPSPASSRRGPEPLNQFLKRLQRVRGAHERVRLLYVATTRARRELHLIGQPSGSDPRQPQAGTLLAALWPALADAFLEAPLAAPPGSAATPAPRVLRRLGPSFRAPEPAPGPPFVGLRVANYEPAAQTRIDWANETARHVGTVVHGALERLGRQPCLPLAGEVGSLAPFVRGALAALGVPADELAEAARRALDALRRMLADPQGRWILEGGHREAASELALTGILDGRLVSVVVDRSFIDSAGNRWVIDFKTSAPHGIAAEAFLEAELELYRPQLARYAALARGLGPQPVRAALYFPLLAALRECDLGAGAGTAVRTSLPQ